MHTHTHTHRAPCEDEERDQGDASTSRGTSKIVIKPPEAEEKPGADSPSQDSEPALLTP